ncbi:hypothetical protein RND81_02G185500 [Saponaria officinalis]|uniref:Exo_endo_phos domain-containing protein n=1 Tax=Saponaria officinalis TaxID=3572 RepID=A0AAW1MVH5_SAPOF
MDRLVDYEGVFRDSIGRKAGVAIIWRRGLRVKHISSSAHHVDVEVKGLFSENVWRLTGFYGWAERDEKELSWKLLKDIKPLSTLPWMVIGDFNQILFETEKREAYVPRAQREMDDFREAIDYCGLMDIGYTRDAFTWWNKKSEPLAIFERLDRGCASLEWMDLFLSLTLKHLGWERSDHVPLKLSRDSRQRRPRKKNVQIRGYVDQL